MVKINKKGIKYVDEDGEVYDVPVGSLLYTPEEQEQIERKKTRLTHRRGVRFSNTSIEAIDYVCDKLTNAQIGYLMVLQKHITYEGLIVNNQKEKKPLNKNGIMKVLDIEGKQSTFKDFRKNCIDSNIIIYDKNNEEYYINRDIIFKGKFKLLKVVSAVCNELASMSKRLDPSEAVMIFKLQRFIHRHTMDLVKNPEETNEKKLEYLNAQELSEELGVSRSYIYRKFKEMTYNNQYVVAKVATGRNGRYMMNPRLFFRGDYSDVQERVTGYFDKMFDVRE